MDYNLIVSTLAPLFTSLVFGALIYLTFKLLNHLLPRISDELSNVLFFILDVSKLLIIIVTLLIIFVVFLVVSTHFTSIVLKMIGR